MAVAARSSAVARSCREPAFINDFSKEITFHVYVLYKTDGHAGTVIGVLIIQTLDSTILFLGVPSAQSPVFFALVVVLVVVVQSPRLRLHRRKRTTDTGSRDSAESPAKVEAGT